MIGYFHKACGTLVFCTEAPFTPGDVVRSRGVTIEVNGRPVHPEYGSMLRCPNEVCFAPIAFGSQYFDVKRT